jgi:hypothetical protein
MTHLCKRAAHLAVTCISAAPQVSRHGMAGTPGTWSSRDGPETASGSHRELRSQWRAAYVRGQRERSHLEVVLHHPVIM